VQENGFFGGYDAMKKKRINRRAAKGCRGRLRAYQQDFEEKLE